MLFVRPSTKGTYSKRLERGTMWPWPNCTSLPFSERLLARLRRFNFACDWIVLRSDHMQSCSRKYEPDGNILAMLGSHIPFERRTWPNAVIVFPNGLLAVRDADILCMWSDRTMIRPYAKYQWRRTAGCQVFCHLVRPQLDLGAHKMMQRRFVFPNGFPVDLDSGTSHAIVSYHDPTTRKVSSENIG
jgi:hypothetical protein